MKFRYYLFLSCLILSFCGTPSQKTKILKGTNWAGSFYHYHNNYFFETDSTGYAEFGQLAWSCPVDTVSLNISGNHILYSEPEYFSYKITDTILTLQYPPDESGDSISTQVFHFRHSENNNHAWVSDYEYAYGREVLVEEKRIEVADSW